MKRAAGVVVSVLLAAFGVARTAAVTSVPSGDGQFWDIQDTSPWAQDSGGIATGGRANPFNGFGYLKLQVRRVTGSVLADNRYLRGFGLHHDGRGRFDSITPVLVEGVLVARGITTSSDTAYLRYVDSFTNTTRDPLLVRVAWGGAVGAYDDGGRVAVASTSDGDARIEATDSHVTVMQNARDVARPREGPSGHGPSAHVLGTRSGVLSGVGDMYGNPFELKYPGFDSAHIGYVFTLRLAPGETRSLLTFVVKGLSEVYDPRGGYPIPFRDALIGGEPVYEGRDARVPAAGSEIARVSAVAAQLAKAPDLAGLTPLQRSRIANWDLGAEARRGATVRAPFSVFEKSTHHRRSRASRTRPARSP